MEKKRMKFPNDSYDKDDCRPLCFPALMREEGEITFVQT